MKILYVTTISNTLNAFLIPHIEQLVEDGHTVDVACKLERPFEDNLLSLVGATYELPFSRSPLRNPYKQLIGQLRDIVKNGGYDIVHTHTPIASAIVRLACRNLPNVRVFYTAHGFHFLKGGPLFNWLTYYPIEKFLSRYTDTLITINHEDYAIAKKNFQMKHLYLVNGVGIDTEKFQPVNEEEKSELKRRLGFDANKKYLIFVGELNANKNQTVLIEMMEQLSKKRQDLVLLLVGHGVLADTYQQQVEEKQLGDFVHLLGYRSDIPDLMKISELALSSSKREGLPVNLIEAMATGLPLVVSNCRGNRDLVETGQNGIVLKEATAEAFADAIEQMIDDEELYQKMQVASMKNAKEYSLVQIKTQLKTIYEKVRNEEENE